jgi:hypothetical protein
MDVKEALHVIEKSLDECKIVHGKRHIVVLDRGWSFVGDLAQEDAGMYILSNAKNIRKWSTGGFGGLSKGAAMSGATLDNCAPIKFSSSAMLFCVPVRGDWENE